MAIDKDEGIFKKPQAAPVAKSKKDKQTYSIYEIFDFAQREETDLPKVVKKLVEIYETTPFDNFANDFKKCLQFTLCAQEKCKQIDKCIQFIVKVVSQLSITEENIRNEKKKENENTEDEEDDDEEEEQMHPLLRFTFNFLFESHNVEDPLIRLRVCQLASKLLGECSEIDSDIFEELSKIMLIRIKDKVSTIRAQAVMALFRLQERTNPNCPVKTAFKFHLSCDPAADVRKTILRFIHLSNDTMSVVLQRLDDTSDKVRKFVYLAVSKHNVLNLSIRQRQTFLKKGLQDRTQNVKDTVKDVLLPVWFSRLDHDYVKFLKALNVLENFEEPALQALEILAKKDEKKSYIEQFKSLVNEQFLIPIENMSPEKSLFWRFVTNYIDKESKENPLLTSTTTPEENENNIIEENEKKLPEMTSFTKYIRAYFLDHKEDNEDDVWNILQSNFNLIQMLRVGRCYDFQDEVGMKHTQDLCIDLLKSSQVNSPDLIKAIIELLALVVPNDETKLSIVAELISDLREPLVNANPNPTPEPVFNAIVPPHQLQKPNMQLARLLVRVNLLEDDIKKALEDEQFGLVEEYCKQATEMKAKIAVLENANKPPTPPTELQRIASMETDEEIQTERQITKDPRILKKCLRILIECLQVIKIQGLTPTLRSLTENVVLPSLMGSDMDEDDLNESDIADHDWLLDLRKDATEALGLLCILDETLAVERMPIFIVLITNPAVTIIALKTVFDLLCKYGLEIFDIDSTLIDIALTDDSNNRNRNRNRSSASLIELDENDENSNCVKLMKILISLLDNGSETQRNLVLMGLCKLLFIGRINSAKLLSRLIVFWFSPDSSTDLYVQQQLGNFFSKFASVCPQAPDILRQATLPSIEEIASAPVDSPLGEVDVDNALKLLIQLTCQQKCSPPNKPHDILAKDILECIIGKKSVVQDLILIKSLHKLEISCESSEVTDELLELAKSAESSLKEKNVVKTMRAYRLYLENQILSKKASLINTRMTEGDTRTRNTLDSNRGDTRSSSLGLSSRTSSQSSGDMNKIVEEDEGSQEKRDELHRRLSLLNLQQSNVVQGSSDEEEEEGLDRDSLVTKRPIIPPTPECTDDEDDDSETGSLDSDSSLSSRRPRRKVPRRR